MVICFEVRSIKRTIWILRVLYICRVDKPPFKLSGNVKKEPPSCNLKDGWMVFARHG
jgi:hypothetical protein